MTAMRLCSTTANCTLRIEADGTVSSIVDQRTNRELVPAGTRLGRYEMLKDEPVHWDAWDIQRDAFLTANALSEASITSVDETANGWGRRACCHSREGR